MRTVPFSLLLAAIVTFAAVASSLAQEAPRFTFGFKALADQIPNVVGQPLEDEHWNEKGDSVQRTTTGLMVWRKADNSTAFTNGAQSWVNGPFGVQSRPNDDRFDWETLPPDPLSPVGHATQFRFGDDFAGGSAQLPWAPYPHFFLDNLQGNTDPTSPSLEKGIGILANENVGGFAALSYVDREVPRDFYLEAWVYITLTEDEKGPLQGLVFRADPSAGRYYRLVARFNADPELSVAYVGSDTNNFPVFLQTWKGEDLPGGLPSGDGWHRLGVEVVGDAAEFYWDGVRLPGGPSPINRVSSGFVGSYATFVGGLGHAETRIDSFRVWQASS